MKRIVQIVSAIAVLSAVSMGAIAEQAMQSVGGDVYIAGSSPSLSADVPRDAFSAGMSPVVEATVLGDLHVVGFDVNAKGKVGQDFYAAGASIQIESNIANDATVAGFSVHMTDRASVAGNVRIAAGTANIESAISGSLVASAGEIKFNAPVTGDAVLKAGDISFGKNARVNGLLRYSAPEKIDIPASVASADKVQFTRISESEVMREVRKGVDEAVPSVWPSSVAIAVGLFITLAFYLTIAALFLAFAPDRVQALSQRVSQSPGRALLFGFIGLATLIGFIPVSIITIVGIPLVPVVILAIVVAWMLGYLLGAYAISIRVARVMEVPPQSPPGQLLALAVGLVVIAMLNYIPIVGWILNFGVVLVGLGAMTAATANWFRWAAPAPELTESTVPSA